MNVGTLEELFIVELSDIYSAEKQLTRALPRLAKAAADGMLAQAFEDHLDETENHVERIEQVADICGIKLKRRKCEAMEGLIDEGSHIIREMDGGPVRDTALISAAQKVEHYEISAYLSLIKLARQLEYRQAVTLLAETLDEEEGADETLSDIGDEGLAEQTWVSRPDRMPGSQWI